MRFIAEPLRELKQVGEDFDEGTKQFKNGTRVVNVPNDYHRREQIIERSDKSLTLENSSLCSQNVPELKSSKIYLTDWQISWST